eukprot:6937231-Pyramimonas_sp.AAC.1
MGQHAQRLELPHGIVGRRQKEVTNTLCWHRRDERCQLTTADCRRIQPRASIFRLPLDERLL